jgi:mannose-6-phosphate isomerase-like protein (cupin superfamily)
LVPAGANHNIINTNTQVPLKMYTLYGPPNHLDGIIRESKKEAEEDPESFDGVATEITYTDI